MKKILITGSCGFIFSNFVRKAAFNKNDYKITSVDKCANPNTMSSIYLNKNQEFHFADITSFDVMDKIFKFESPDIVLHTAAESFVCNSIDNPLPFIHSNVVGTQVIIDLCLKYKVERLFFTSTDEVLGQLTADQASLKEEAPLLPRNSYSATKAAGELLIKAAASTHGLSYTILRFCNNYGPRQASRNLIPMIIKNISEGTPVRIHGEGREIREWIYVDDTISAVNLLLDKGKEGEIYHVSTGYEFSNLEVFHEITNLMGRGHELLTFVQNRKGNDFRYSTDCQKIKDLGWSPKVKFKEGLQNTIDWYLKNPWFTRGL